MRMATAALLVLTGALPTGCAGMGGTAATTTATIDATATSDATDASVGGIPDGTWTREITTAEIDRRGLDLSADFITTNYLEDGSLPVVLKTVGPRWSILIQDDSGAYEVGDLGESSYDDTGRWVQTGDGTGRTLVLQWELDGDTLTTSGLTSAADEAPPDDGEHLILEGTWLRDE